MALGFFRRNQKMVVGIMVLLMIAFLVGSFGMQMLSGEGGQGRARPVVTFGAAANITDADYQGARSDLDFLMRHLNLGGGATTDDHLYMMLVAVNDPRRTADEDQIADHVLAYAALRNEARRADVQVTGLEVDVFLAQRGMDGARLDSFIADIRERLRMPAREMRDIVARWVAVRKLAISAVPAAPPSEPQVRQAMRDAYESIQVRMVQLGVDEFVRQVDPPTDAQVRQFYERWSQVEPGRYTEDNPFGVGYLQPRRIGLDYLLVNQDAIERAIEPTEEELRLFHRQHADWYVEEPEDPNAQAERLPFSQAREQVRRDLQWQMAQRRAESLLNEIRRQRDLLESRQQDAGFRVIAAQLVRPADDLLQRQVELDLQNVPVQQALSVLAREAGLRQIVFPLGEYLGSRLDPELMVSLSGEMPLGEALGRLTEQVQFAPMRWSTVADFPQTIFPEWEEASLLPIHVDSLPPMSLRALGFHPLVRSARSGPEVDARAMVDVLDDLTQRQDEVQPEQFGLGAAMHVRDGVDGRLLWQITQILPRQASDFEAVRERVAYDWSRREALRLAEQFAGQIRSARELDELMEARGVSARETEFFTRSRPPALGLPAGATGQIRDFLRAAFTLVPENRDQFEPVGDRIAVASLPAMQGVVVMHRIGYRPPLEDDYDAMRLWVLSNLHREQFALSIEHWLALRNIAQRLGGMELVRN